MTRKLESAMKPILLAGALLCGVLMLQAAEAVAKKPLTIFDDPVLARGRGLEIKQSQVDEMFSAFRANRAAVGQSIPEPQRPKIEADILEKLIATQLCLNRATD